MEFNELLEKRRSVRKYILSNPTQKIKSLETVRFQSFLTGPSGET